MTEPKRERRVEVTFQAGTGAERGEKKVGIWIRVSSEDQVKGESPEHHEARARMYAEMKGWDVATVYRLDAVSGKSVLGHPEARRMLADVSAGSITVLIFSKIARLARNTRELIDIAEIFRRYDADLVSLQESIDTSTPGGRNIFRIMASMAEWEREEIAERVAASVPVRAKLGKSLGGAAPFGYEWHEGRLRLHEGEAPVRREIYTLFLRERRLKQVARLLNDQGFRTRKGSRWSLAHRDRILEEPAHRGVAPSKPGLWNWKRSVRVSRARSISLRYSGRRAKRSSPKRRRSSAAGRSFSLRNSGRSSRPWSNASRSGRTRLTFPFTFLPLVPKIVARAQHTLKVASRTLGRWKSCPIKSAEAAA